MFVNKDEYCVEIKDEWLHWEKLVTFARQATLTNVQLSKLIDELKLSSHEIIERELRPGSDCNALDQQKQRFSEEAQNAIKGILAEFSTH